MSAPAIPSARPRDAGTSPPRNAGPAVRDARFADALRVARGRAARSAPSAAPAGSGGAATQGLPAMPPAPNAPDPAAVPAVAALRAALRALPATLDAARAAGGRLALDLGPALGVDLRTGPAGIELALRPAAGVAHAAAAGLPSLVAALEARGLRVARAEIRARGGDARRPR